MTLLELSICETEDNMLTSMQWIFADEAAEDLVYLPRAGPRLTNCSIVSITDRAPIEKIRVIRSDNDQLSGFGIRLYEVEEPLIIGSTS